MTGIEKAANVLTSIISLERGGREGTYKNVAVKQDVSKWRIQRIARQLRQVGLIEIKSTRYRDNATMHIMCVTAKGVAFRELIISGVDGEPPFDV